MSSDVGRPLLIAFRLRGNSREYQRELRLIAAEKGDNFLESIYIHYSTDFSVLHQ